MDKRMDKYDKEINEDIPTRSDKYKGLYRQIYNAYDEFENLVVPSNAKEITPMELKKEITSRSDYHKMKEYSDITNINQNNNKIVRKEIIHEQQRQENEIYDIKELLNKAVETNKGPELIQPILTNEDYLKSLFNGKGDSELDDKRTNIEQVKEIYDEIREDSRDENEALMETANLSLEILSDLKGDNDKTIVNPPIKDEEWPEGKEDNKFYSNTYKFSKKDFEDKKVDNIQEDFYDDEMEDEKSNSKFFFKIIILIFGISLVGVIIVYLFNYFNRV